MVRIPLSINYENDAPAKGTPMKYLATVFSILLFSIGVSAQVTLAPIFSDHAVLQRAKPIRVWGTARPGEVVHLEFSSQKADTITDSNGRWQATLKSMSAGGPYDMIVSGSNKVVVHDLLLGEVWLASGQSNMELRMVSIDHAGQEIAAANHPQLRIFKVELQNVPDPATTMRGRWEISTPQAAEQFTAVGYFFGLNLLNDLKVPIGIINDSVGGTPAEAWTPLPLLTADPLFRSNALQSNEALRNYPKDSLQFKETLGTWETKYDAADKGNLGLAAGYAAPDTVTEDWKTVIIPSTGKILGLQGASAVWIRRDITLPSRAYKLPMRLDLGPMRESNIAYVNSVKIGSSPMEPIPYRAANSVYFVPAALLHAGKNTIAVRIFSHQPAHMILGTRLTDLNIPASETDPDPFHMSLTGEWNYRVEHDQPLSIEALQSQPVPPALVPSQTSSSLYNGMIFPLGNISLRGIIWYQGETNAGRAAQYSPLLTHLITAWRSQWNEQLPFFIVQLPNYENNSTDWVTLRAQQAEVAKSVPNTALAVTIDLGEPDNIHPHTKRPVGDRLALLARHRVYGEDINDSGPIFKDFTVKKDKIKIQLAHANGLHATAPTISNFMIAGKDQVFMPATAGIEGTRILLSNPAVPSPVAARYAWTNNPEGCDIYNSDGLPLAPFRTDIWVTAPQSAAPKALAVPVKP